MLKKKIIIFMFLLIGVLLISNNVKGENEKYTATDTINGVVAKFEYNLNDKGEVENLKCTNATELSGNVTIPSIIDGKNVVSIGNSGFEKANKITEITIPNLVTRIDACAFEKCTGLTKINFGTGVQSLGVSAFRGCTGLKTLELPKSLKHGSVFGEPFAECTNITSVTFEEGTTIIAEAICSGLTGITEITIPNSVTQIDLCAFENCTGLTKVNFGTGIKEIAVSAFRGCTGLKTLELPKSLKHSSIFGPPFKGCTNITSVIFEDGMSKITESICEGLTGITEITVPNSVTEIELCAFKNCQNLKKITILDNVTKISDSSFENHNEDLTIYCYKDSYVDGYGDRNKIKRVYLPRPVIKELTATVEYSPSGETSGKVIVTIKTNKKVEKVEGWTLSEDAQILTKEYYENKIEIVKLKDIDGKIKDVEVKVDNIAHNIVKDEDKKVEIKDNISNKADDITVTPEKKLPQTGTNTTVIALIGIVAVLSVSIFYKVRKYKGIK